MKLADFLRSETVNLPIDGFDERVETFDLFLKRAFESYLVELGKLNDQEFPGICSNVLGSSGVTAQLCNQIVSATNRYLHGHPAQAYQCIEQSLHAASVTDLKFTLGKEVVEALPERPPGLPDGHINAILNPWMYRMRTGAPAIGLSGVDLFHVPFEKRHLVSNQRYSIAGLPCLYLGSSAWVCWEELGRPDLDKVFISQFRIAKKVKVLDFHVTPKDLWEAFYQRHLFLQNHQAQTLENFKNFPTFDAGFVESYIRLWPLIAACSVKRRMGQGSFFPQYIVPQMLLQWIRQEDEIDGIRYFSTHTPRGAFAFYNYAFPVRNIKHEGRCSYLRDKFRLTDPISWALLSQIPLRGQVLIDDPSNRGVEIALSGDTRINYDGTGFYSAELTLKMLEKQAPHFSKEVKP
jgi:hypothetical protein